MALQQLCCQGPPDWTTRLEAITSHVSSPAPPLQAESAAAWRSSCRSPAGYRRTDNRRLSRGRFSKVWQTSVFVSQTGLVCDVCVLVFCW